MTNAEEFLLALQKAKEERDKDIERLRDVAVLDFIAAIESDVDIATDGLECGGV